MELKQLSFEQVAALYRDELTAVFPPSELKPLAAIEGLMRAGRYQALAMMDGERLRAYALIWMDRDRQYALLDYFGVMRGMRGTGLGGQMLALLAEPCPELLGEAEAPDSGDPETDTLRRRRLAFYQRNGFRLLDYDCALFGVHYRTFYRGPEMDDRQVLRAHRKIYSDHFAPEHLKRYIQIPLRAGEEIPAPTDWREEGRP